MEGRQRVATRKSGTEGTEPPVTPPRDPEQEPDQLSNSDFLAWDIVDEWGTQSFPASDPPSNW
jgi:hypothetical protein